MENLDNIRIEQIQNWLSRADELTNRLKADWAKESSPQLRERLAARINQLAQDIARFEDNWVSLKLAVEPDKNAEYHARLYLRLARAHTNAENYELAIAAYGRAIENSPAPIPSINSERAAVLARTGRWQEAIAAYDVVLSLEKHQQDVTALLGKGIALYHLGDLEAATPNLQQATELARIEDLINEELLALSYLAATAMVQKKPSEALTCLNRAVELGSSSADSENLSSLYYNRGSVYQFMESDTRAASDFETAVRLNPKNEQARKERAKIRKKINVPQNNPELAKILNQNKLPNLTGKLLTNTIKQFTVLPITKALDFPISTYESVKRYNYGHAFISTTEVNTVQNLPVFTQTQFQYFLGYYDDKITSDLVKYFATFNITKTLDFPVSTYESVKRYNYGHAFI